MRLIQLLTASVLLSLAAPSLHAQTDFDKKAFDALSDKEFEAIKNVTDKFLKVSGELIFVSRPKEIHVAEVYADVMEQTANMLTQREDFALLKLTVPQVQMMVRYFFLQDNDTPQPVNAITKEILQRFRESYTYDKPRIAALNQRYQQTVQDRYTKAELEAIVRRWEEKRLEEAKRRLFEAAKEGQKRAKEKPAQGGR